MPQTEGTTLTSRPQAADRESGVQVLSRAAEILRLLKVSPGGLTQAEIAAGVGLARTTVHRILNALADEGFVQPNGRSNRYRLGTEVLHMADAARASLITEIHPYLEQLSRDLDETVDFSILDRDHMTFIDQVVSPQRLRAVSAVGSSFPLHCTANGKAVLANLSAPDAAKILPEKLTAFTPNTIIRHDKLQQELKSIRLKGFARDIEEHSLGICAIGVSLHDTPLGHAAISVPMPAQRFAGKEKSALSGLRKTAAQIATALAK
jgi:DNA-binding IclR family transcriptional regulator